MKTKVETKMELAENQIEALEDVYQAACGLANALDYEEHLKDPRINQLLNLIVWLRPWTKMEGNIPTHGEIEIDEIGALRFFKVGDAFFTETNDIGDEYPDIRAHYWQVSYLVTNEWLGNIIYDDTWGRLMFRPAPVASKETRIISSVALQAISRFIEKNCKASRRDRALYDASVAQEQAKSFDV